MSVLFSHWTVHNCFIILNLPSKIKSMWIEKNQPLKIKKAIG
jgi:hypothetical protein